MGTKTRSSPRYSSAQVVARDAADRLGVEAGEAADAVIGVHDDVAGAQVGEGMDGAAAARLGPLRAPPPQQAVVGDHGELELRSDEALAQAGDARTSSPAVPGLAALAVEARAAGGRGCRRRARPRRGVPSATTVR